MKVYNEGQPIVISGKKVDSWCLGIVLYALLNAAHPFSEKQLEELSAGRMQTARLAYLRPFTKEAKDLCSSLLTINPNHRLSVTNILSHPWMR